MPPAESPVYQTLRQQYQDLGWPLDLLDKKLDFTIFYLANLPLPLPKVFVLNPGVEYRNHTHPHFYPADNSLCLYYPGDLNWSDKHHLHDKTIPWLAKWLVFYELYQITGRWEGSAVGHC